MINTDIIYTLVALLLISPIVYSMYTAIKEYKEETKPIPIYNPNTDLASCYHYTNHLTLIYDRNLEFKRTYDYSRSAWEVTEYNAGKVVNQVFITEEYIYRSGCNNWWEICNKIKNDNNKFYTDGSNDIPSKQVCTINKRSV